MKLGVLTVPFSDQPLEEILPYLHNLGVQAVELGTGGYTNKAHCKPSVYLNHPDKIDDLKRILEKNEMEISALSCHGNPIHPDKVIAERDHQAFLDTIELAELLGVKTVVTFSGCPGDPETSKYPNWVVCPWPQDFSEVLEWQWNEILIPYWRKAAQIAKKAGVKIALEMHPGFCVYNTETLLKLREATDDVIGANFDPSHLFWQGMDASVAIRKLGNAIHYVHAKDCYVDNDIMHQIGVLDTKPYGNLLNRAWSFRTVGYGHNEKVWRDIISTLRLVGYDRVISIEHEDAMMSVNEGLEKAVDFLKKLCIYEQPCQMWWS